MRSTPNVKTRVTAMTRRMSRRGLARAISMRCQRAIWSLVLAAAVASRLCRSDPPNRLARMSGATGRAGVALPRGDLVSRVGSGSGQQALQVGSSEPAGQDEWCDSLVDGGIAQLFGKGV